jgi:hypothetical protein
MPKGSCVCGDFTYEFEGQPEATVCRMWRSQVLMLSQKSVLMFEKQIICHCIPCQKTAGANGSYNLIVKEDKVCLSSSSSLHRSPLNRPPQLKKLSGTPKPFTRPGESGKNLDYQLCDTCGTIMLCHIGAVPGVVLVKAGTLDDREYLEKHGKPVQEIYTRNRPSWCAEWRGVEQREGA